MADLTDFQSRCIERVVTLLDESGEPYTREVTEVFYGGENVLDVCLFLNTSDIKVWIYSDEAQFRNDRDMDQRFESADYEDDNRLIDEFVSALAKRVQANSGQADH